MKKYTLIRLASSVISLSLVACGISEEGGIVSSDEALVEIDAEEVVGFGLEEDFVPGQYIAVLREGASGDALAQKHGARKGLELNNGRAVVFQDVNPQLLELLARDLDVEEIIPDAIARIAAPPSGGSTAEVLPSGVDRIGADEISNKGAGVKVCVVDTGIDYNHSDLAGNYLGGKDFVNNDNDPLDDNGHGTHVAGTIAAIDNTTDVIGVAPQAKLIAAKVLNRRGSGSYSAITAGIDYCVAQGANVINMSLGGTFDDPSQRAALQNARNAGVTVVVAAGNDGVNLDTDPHFPANYDGIVITVSAAWIDDTSRTFGSTISYPTFSNYGTAVDLSAPGVYVVSTKKGGGTTSMSGTSMASPHVAGAAALYIASHPGASPSQVESALESSTENVNNVSVHPEELLNVRSF